MSLTSEERKAIVDLKISKAENAYKDMCRCFDMGMYSTAANRLYYSMFYASSALLVNEGHEAHTHSGNLSLLNMYFIKGGRLPKQFGKLLRDVFRLRQCSDYDDYYDVDKEDLAAYLEPVHRFIDAVKILISNNS